jgi:hypothetical protein
MTAALVALAGPASALDVDLQAPEILCGSGAPYLAVLVSIQPSNAGFGASATAHMCNTDAIETAITMQAVGAGGSAAPGVAGGPILFAPFQTKAGNDAAVSGYSGAPSASVQAVVLNITGAGVAVASSPTNTCQIYYDRLVGQPFKLDGCNAAVQILNG